MYSFDRRLQYPVKVETPDPLFARMLQQAIGGVEGEIRVCMQYFFQAWGAAARPRNIATCCSTRQPRKSATSKCWRPP
jgi:Mn-containing catalase